MTRAEREAIRARCEAANLPKLNAYRHMDLTSPGVRPPLDHRRVVDTVEMLDATLGALSERMADGRALLAEVDRLEAERDAAQRALAEAEERAERAGRERNELRIACGEEARKALEAQAREVALREALSSICGHVFNTTDVWHIAHDALLAVPADDAALREFGLRVVDECFRQAGASTLVDGISAIDAVLRGSR
jgi:hypothetical protein